VSSDSHERHGDRAVLVIANDWVRRQWEMGDQWRYSKAISSHLSSHDPNFAWVKIRSDTMMTAMLPHPALLYCTWPMFTSGQVRSRHVKLSAKLGLFFELKAICTEWNEEVIPNAQWEATADIIIGLHKLYDQKSVWTVPIKTGPRRSSHGNCWYAKFFLPCLNAGTWNTDRDTERAGTSHDEENFFARSGLSNFQEHFYRSQHIVIFSFASGTA